LILCDFRQDLFNDTEYIVFHATYTIFLVNLPQCLSAHILRLLMAAATTVTITLTITTTTTSTTAYSIFLNMITIYYFDLYLL
jgi:hypothetical protein